jgi:mannosyl-3-phosphoglycerate phosphatase
MKKALIFTDLDGSLLDHRTYSYSAASPILSRLKKNKIPLIPVSSKTFDEIIILRKRLNNNDPFIVENGAAIYIPKDYFTEQPEKTKTIKNNDSVFWEYTTAKPRNYWVEILTEIETEFKNQFLTFSALGDAGIVKHTGLSIEQSKRANQRNFSEPLLWIGKQSKKIDFIDAIKSMGADIVAGGRFLHVIDPLSCKGSSMEWLKKTYKDDEPKNNYLSIAAGDSANDISMLNVADFSAVIRSPVHSRPKLKNEKKCYISDQFGPLGWNQIINIILEENFKTKK